MGTTSTRPTGRKADFAARFLVRAALTAPSVHNTQPWRFVSHRDRLELYADLSRPLRVGDPAGREMVISCGAALFNVRLAIRHLGFVPRMRLLPDTSRPDLLAEIGWGEYATPTELDDLLYRALPRRHTHRGPFDTVPVSPWLIGELCDVVRRQRATLYPVRDEAERRRLAAIVRTAELAQRADGRFTLERARWAPAPELVRADGIPATAYPMQPDGLQVLFAGRDFAAGAPWGFPLRARKLDGRAVGAVAVLATPSDRRLDWLLSGQALQHLLLYATAHGIKVALHTQPLELPDLRAKIRSQLLGRSGHPQVILRLGHSAQVLTTPRRSVPDTLTEAE
ncbi:MAG TPA: hypothetical protein VFU43_28735 [Streptosporangiaceae bacterium]|nr:hypothetical protein [Streptosporangiaceae bacterium]